MTEIRKLSIEGQVFDINPDEDYSDRLVSIAKKKIDFPVRIDDVRHIIKEIDDRCMVDLSITKSDGTKETKNAKLANIRFADMGNIVVTFEYYND